MSKKSLDSNSPSSTGHGFGLGLLVGGMAGIASYYLFGTKDGERLRKKLVEEFEYAQVAIPKEISQRLAESDLTSAQQVGQEFPGQVKGLADQLLAKVTGKANTEPETTQLEKEKPTKRVFFKKSGKKLT